MADVVKSMGVHVTPKAKTIELRISLNDEPYSMKKRIPKESVAGKKVIAAMKAIEKEVIDGGNAKAKAHT